MESPRIVYISYSHEDRQWRDRVALYLSRYERDGVFSVWDDQRIRPGDAWEEKINQALESAQIALLLVSSSSLNSKFINEYEVQRFLEMRNPRRFIPVLLSPCNWQDVPWLARVQMYPPGARPLETMTDAEVETALELLAKEVVDLLTRFPPQTVPAEQQSGSDSRRKSNVLGEVFGLTEGSIPFQPLRKQKELEAIKRDLLVLRTRSEPHILGICGLAGTGKTTLALALAEDEEVRRTFVDGVFYLRLHTETTIHQQLRDAVSNAVPEVTTASNYQLLTVLAERKVLLILDEPDFDRNDVSYLIPAVAERTAVVVATRNMPALQKLRASSIHVIGKPFVGSIDVSDDSGQPLSELEEKLRLGEVTLNKFLEIDESQSMRKADQAAFRVGAALAQSSNSDEFNSSDLFAGYLLTGKPGKTHSEQAFVKAAWDDYSANHPDETKSGKVEMWRIISQRDLQDIVKASGSSSSIGNCKLSSGLGRMLLRSSKVAAEAEHSQTFSTRHLLACLLGPREWELDPAGAAEIRKFALNFPAVRRAFRDWIMQSRKDNPAVINAVLGLTDKQAKRPLEMAAEVAFQKTYSAFVPDRAAFGRLAADAPLDDALGVGVHAGHLAQLIAAKETWMPLSIGLFGAWGAGKSHFIDLLDEHLRALTRDAGKVFHKRIVQIRFNAWHYLDTNLWASLVSEIFDGLFAALEERKDTTTEQVQKLKGELAKQSALAAEAKEALKTAETARVDAEARLRIAMQERIVEEGKVGALLDDLKSLVTDENLIGQLRVVAEGLGMPKLETSFEVLEARANEVRTLGGRTKALALAIFTGPGLWRRGLLLAVALAVPLAVAWLAEHGTTEIQKLLEGTGRTIAQVVAAIAALSAWISSQVKAGSSLVSKVESAYDKVKKARTAREGKDDAAKALKLLAVKRQAEEEARHTLHEAEQKMKTIRADLAELAPGRQLIRFLKERASAEDYRRHLGLVSLVRRDFEQLSQLLTSATEKEDISLPRIDRIVLYIDDLDRCRADRVIEVLEAVHLLLAFPLFAVVVAVDPRWLRQSLLDQYPRLLGHADGDGTNIRSASMGRAATPQDYLEKIFQVPFNLQPIEKTGFDALVGQLFPIATRLTEPTRRAMVLDAAQTYPISIPPATAAKSQIATAQTVKPEPSAESRDQLSSEVPSAQLEQPPAPDPQRLALTRKEVMDVQRFQPLFQTPRAVKRLANTYCLIRVGVNESDWNDYLGADESPGSYRIPMLLLAVTSAFPSLARPWLLWLRETAPTRWHLANKDVTALVGKYRDTTDHEDWNRLAQCLNQLDLKDWPSPEGEPLLKWVPRVARYSF